MKTFKSIIGVSLTLIMIFGLFAIVPLKSSAADSYVKVTEAPTDWSGDYLIVYEGGNVAFNGSLETLNVSGNKIDVTIDNNAIASSTTTDAAKFTIAAVSGGYSIRNASGKYVGSNTNNSNTVVSSDSVLINTIEWNNNSVKITSSAGSVLRYNTSASCFRYYKSGSYSSQQPIQLYKLNGSGGDTPTEPEPTTAAATTAEPTTAPATAVPTLNGAWYKASASEVKNGDTVIVTMIKQDGSVYGLDNDNGTSSAPTAVSFTVDSSDESLVGTDESYANCSWKVGRDGDNFTFATPSDDSEKLYCTATNNGVRVGGVESNTFVISGSYLKNNATSRYIGIYNNQDWRCYTSSGSNIANQTLQFWKFVDDSGDTPTEPEPTTAAPATDPVTEPATSAVIETVVDIIDADFTGNPSSYTAWSNTGISNAVYSGQSSGGENYVQIRADNPSGIVTTASYGRVTKIEVAWDHVHNSSKRTLDIYGDNTAYTSSSELYGASPKGAKLGSMVFDNTTVALVDDYITELDITGDYKYIGIRTLSGAAYLKSIKITWEVYETPTEPEPTTVPEEPTTEEPTEATTEAPTETPTDPIVNTYTVRWLDYDGTELASENYTEGETPVYPNSNPETYYDDTYRYTFTGWSPAISAVTSNTDYTAVYSSEPLAYYTVTWNNYDGTELDHRDYPEGKVPKYYGELPYKPDDGDCRYVFSGWTPALEVIVDHNVTYTATFTRVEKTSSILPMDTDVVSKMENSYYLYDGELLVLGEINGFSVDGDKLMLGDSVVADVEESDTHRLGNTVYVKGIGTSDKPYEFYPNYIYGKSTGDISGYQDRIDVEDCKPGDGFVGYSKVYVGDSLISFMADSAVNATTSNGFIGVGKDNYGYRYINQNAVEYNGHGPYEFDNDEHILYYGGVNDSNAYVFSTVSPEYIAEYYRRFSEKEADIFEKGRIEYFLDDDDYIYSYSNGVFTRISQEETEITELINQVVTPSDSDVIFQNNTNLLNQYFGGRLLGFQKKLTNLDIEEDKSDSLRFMTVLSSKVLKKLYNNNNADFGYVFAAVEGDRVNEINIEKLTVNNGNKYSCKNTTNKLSGIFGNKDFDSTDYKYLTAGIDEIPAGYTLAVRFYITYKGETHYINYPARDTLGIVFNSSDYVS